MPTKRQTEVGELPADWSCSSLGDVADILTGFPFPSAGYSGTGVRLLRGSNVKRDQIEWREDLTMYWPEVTGDVRKYVLKVGDVVIAMDGSLVGRSFGALSEHDVPALLLQRVARVRSSEVDVGYLKHWICSERFTTHSDAVKTTTAIPHISPGDIRSFKVALPPTTTEQQQIGQALTDADALIVSLEQLLTKKRQIKQGAMQELLTGKRRLPGFNDPWIPRSMADLFNFSGGLSASRDQLGDIGPCYLHYGDIHLSHKTYIDLDAEHHQMPRLDVDPRKVSASALLRNGDVVFVDASEDDQGVSKHVVVHSREAQPLISGLHTIVARPKSDELVDLYKRYCFQAPPVQAQFRFYAVGTKVSGVSKGNIGKIMLNVPSPVEQKEIAACLAEMDTELSALESRLTKARALKQAMAQALLTGKIRLI